MFLIELCRIRVVVRREDDRKWSARGGLLSTSAGRQTRVTGGVVTLVEKVLAGSSARLGRL